MSTIRLACLFCDNDSFDPTLPLDAFVAGWTDISEAVQTIPPCESAWWDHFGVCPECKEDYA